MQAPDGLGRGRLDRVGDGQQAARKIGVVAVVPGAGFQELFRGMGAAALVEGGQTMNPSVQDMLAAVVSVG